MTPKIRCKIATGRDISRLMRQHNRDYAGYLLGLKKLGDFLAKNNAHPVILGSSAENPLLLLRLCRTYIIIMQRPSTDGITKNSQFSCPTKLPCPTKPIGRSRERSRKTRSLRCYYELPVEKKRGEQQMSAHDKECENATNEISDKEAAHICCVVFAAYHDCLSVLNRLGHDIIKEVDSYIFISTDRKLRITVGVTDKPDIYYFPDTTYAERTEFCVFYIYNQDFDQPEVLPLRFIIPVREMVLPLPELGDKPLLTIPNGELSYFHTDELLKLKGRYLEKWDLFRI